MQQHSKYEYRIRALPRWALVAVMGLLASCANLTSSQPPPPQQQKVAPAPAGVNAHPAVRFAATSEEGAYARIEDPTVGGLVDVEVGSQYISANGRSCHRFTTTAVGGIRIVRSWAVCRDQSGVWHLITAAAMPLDR